ncbi:hypothetical protein OS493_008037 [Desmophyllum pertusum]|uniref:Uncharacterized protein n=1 Tax=Desmophyllum pertusum TaxID=174260 RepID=A0A9X0CI41_9CNID|nr:hypothetical protein OS493_008037 [Desmophyllum pertusum]
METARANERGANLQMSKENNGKVERIHPSRSRNLQNFAELITLPLYESCTRVKFCA